MLPIFGHARGRGLILGDGNLGEFDRVEGCGARTGVSFDRDRMWVDLSDGRSIGVPLTWFPRLLNADPGEKDGSS